MSLKETKKISANRYELEILVDGEKFRQAIKDAYKQNIENETSDIYNMFNTNSGACQLQLVDEIQRSLAKPR